MLSEEKRFKLREIFQAFLEGVDTNNLFTQIDDLYDKIYQSPKIHYTKVNEFKKELDLIPDVAQLWTNKNINIYGKNMNVYPIETVENVLVSCIILGIDDTIEKIEKQLLISEYNCYHVITLSGLKIDRTYFLNDNIKIIPYNNLPMSHRELVSKELNLYSCNISFFTNIEEMVAIIYSGKATISNRNENTDRNSKYDQIESLMKSIALLLPLVTNQPSFFVYEYGILDSDCLLFYSKDSTKIRHEMNPIDSRFIDKVNINVKCLLSIQKQYIQLDKDFKNFIIKVIHRYSIACSRNDPFDLAVELRIILEIILANDIEEYIKENISVRGSWLLEKDLNKRISLILFFKKAYKTCSECIHGEIKLLDENNLLTIMKLKNICSELILKLISIGYFPNATQWKRIVQGEDPNEISMNYNPLNK